MSTRIKIAKVQDVPAGRAKATEADGRPVALFNLDGTYYAIDNACTHAGGSLSEGTIDGNEVICPLHGARFDLADGKATGPPAQVPVSSYKVHVDGDDIAIELPEDAA